MKIKSIASIMIACLCMSIVHTACQSQAKQQPATQSSQLTDKQRKILKRIVELSKEAALPSKPFQSLKFDEKRKQWVADFGTDRPDDGYFVYINDENSTRIDILLCPPMWTKYERKQTPN